MKRILYKIVVVVLWVLARAYRPKYNPKIIFVTGSVGKTSTKDAIYAGLKPFFNVRKNKKSYNSQFGMPLTIIDESTGWANPLRWAVIFARAFWKLLTIKRKSYPEWLVLEAGVGKPGD